MSDMLQSLLQKADETCQMGIAAFTRLARRVIRPAVLRLVLRRMILFRPLQRSCKLGNLKAVKTASQRFATALTSRKTAGLITLRASRVNAAVIP